MILFLILFLIVLLILFIACCLCVGAYAVASNAVSKFPTAMQEEGLRSWADVISGRKHITGWHVIVIAIPVYFGLTLCGVDCYKPVQMFIDWHPSAVPTMASNIFGWTLLALSVVIGIVLKKRRKHTTKEANFFKRLVEAEDSGLVIPGTSVRPTAAATEAWALRRAGYHRKQDKHSKKIQDEVGNHILRGAVLGIVHLGILVLAVFLIHVLEPYEKIHGVMIFSWVLSLITLYSGYKVIMTAFVGCSTPTHL